MFSVLSSRKVSFTHNVWRGGAESNDGAEFGQVALEATDVDVHDEGGLERLRVAVGYSRRHGTPSAGFMPAGVGANVWGVASRSACTLHCQPLRD